MKRRTLPTAAASALLVLAAPGVASAHHARHHARRHHAHHARVLTFGNVLAAPTTSTSAPATTTSSPTAPSSEPAGTVVSYTEGVLTIKLKDNSLVSGKVTEQTRLECRSATAASSGGDDQGGGDDQEEGASSGEHGGPLMGHASDNAAGDQQGGEGGEDQGEDSGQENSQSCTPAALVANAVVLGAELELTGTGAIWEKVELSQ